MIVNHKESAFSPGSYVNHIEQEYIKQLKSLLRYDRFRGDESEIEWVQLLGPDVLSLTHPHATLKITRNFISYNQFHDVPLTELESEQLKIATLVHDWGELKIDGKGIGDVSYDQKTEAHEKDEAAIFKQVVTDIKNEDEREMLTIIYTEVVLDRKSKLGSMFNAIERIGYLQTAIRAYEGVDGEHITNWIGLVGNVLSNQIEPLLKYRKNYPYVDYVINKSISIITEILETVPTNQAPLDRDGNPSYDVAKLQKAKEFWLFAL